MPAPPRASGRPARALQMCEAWRWGEGSPSAALPSGTCVRPSAGGGFPEKVPPSSHPRVRAGVLTARAFAKCWGGACPPLEVSRWVNEWHCGAGAGRTRPATALRWPEQNREQAPGAAVGCRRLLQAGCWSRCPGLPGCPCPRRPESVGGGTVGTVPGPERACCPLPLQKESRA